MIRRDNRIAALKSLHAVVLKGRTMAYDKEPHGRISKLLDDAEYLVALLYHSDDMTDTYRKYIYEVAEEFGIGSVRELM